MNITLSKLKKNRTLIHGGLFSLFSFFNRGIAFLLLILLAKYILPEEYGELSLFNTLVMFLGYFVGLSTAGYLSISFFQGNKEEFRNDFSAICLITVLVTIAVGLVFLLFHNYLSVWLNIESPFLFIALVIAFCTVFVQLNLDYLRVQEDVSLFGVLSCTFAVCNLIFSLYMVIACNLSWKGRIYAQVICNILYFIIAGIWFYRDGLFCFFKDYARYKTIIYWSVPLIPHLATNWIRQGCDRYIIENSHSIADVGLFSFALNLTNIIIMVGSAFNSTNSVSLYKTLSSSLNSDEKKAKLLHQEHIILYVYIVSSLIITILGIILVPIILPKYTESIIYFTILSISGFLQCIYFLYCNYLFYFKRTKVLMHITFGTSILHLCLSLIFTRYSLILTCIVYVISLLVMVMMVKNKVRKLIKFNKV